MVHKDISEVTAAYALEYMKKVASGEEQALDSPLVFAEGGTCYAFSSHGDPNKKADWRADGYRWRHNGKTKIKTGGCIIVRTYYNAFSAPKVTTAEFRRLSHECSAYPDIVIVHYKGLHSMAGEFPHGNRRCDSKPYLRTRPSIITACKNADGNPSAIFKDMVNSSEPTDSVESMMSVPRNRLQISNVKKYMRRKKKIAEITVNRLRDIVCDAEYTYEVISDPDLIVAAYQEPRLEEFKKAFTNLPPAEAQFLSLNTVYEYQNFNVSLILYRHDIHVDGLPLIFLIHDCDTPITHNTVWSVTSKKLPKLASADNLCLLASDRGLCCEQSELITYSQSFCDIIEKLKKWRENPCASVWELQKEANHFFLLSQHYRKVGKNTEAARKRRKRCNGLFGLKEDGALKFDPIPETGLAQDCDMLPEVESSAALNTASSISKLIKDTKKLAKHDSVQYDSSTGTFIVSGDTVRTVELFPKEKCSCLASPQCKHILACRYTIGIPLPSSKAVKYKTAATRKYVVSSKRRRILGGSVEENNIVIEITPSDQDFEDDEDYESVQPSDEEHDSAVEPITIELMTHDPPIEERPLDDSES